MEEGKVTKCSQINWKDSKERKNEVECNRTKEV